MFSEFFRFVSENLKFSDFFRFCSFCYFVFFLLLVFLVSCFLVHDGGLLKGVFASSPTLVVASLPLVHFITCFRLVVPFANNVNNYGKMQVPLDMYFFENCVEQMQKHRRPMHVWN